MEFISENPKVASFLYDSTALSDYIYYNIEPISWGETDVYVKCKQCGAESEKLHVIVDLPKTTTSPSVPKAENKTTKAETSKATDPSESVQGENSDTPAPNTTEMVDAIYYDNGVGNVYVYQDGTVHKVEVEVGLYNTELAEIKSGLTADDLVISTWSSQLYEGSTVNLKGEETDAAAADEAGNQKADAPAGSENGQKAGAPAEGGNDQPVGDAGAPKDAKTGQKK